ncbi:cysteine dioxygenase [Cupriavidus taiwanensis]|uniref:Putative Cysteine dioxygenase type I n=1 Tax=Cupriavidus taiwanensis TaxID=164546 RepID=A0A375II17_9BURK|nr:cysteine dioxygenase [Cupriavidus taiwanensis]SOY66387.1 putative Cysteine dioxygenase type I [Cupriavidus taiwanensis]SOY66390.1 putative Cysteine dioxygenase type I [Cupriavidus taiwanensis]SOY94360.1 putative Cysteine dioxygenase type I [Cupriavidus taiwanensis]SOZ27965.1 putative Cysteine dioxygenase type I [Cupriavidus taiwanensis]SOZ70508.1 putative Cysteine dioxygenase type I [Cupriavidus taiwanensis]
MGSSPDPNALAPLRDFITGLAALLDQHPDESRILREGGALLATLVARDDWLPEAWARPHPEYYQQHLLHCDSAERFSIVSFVWGPGQRTPIHDHTVWGLIGMLRGAEDAQPFALDTAGRPVASGASVRLLPGQVEAVSPAVGDIHRVNNVYDDRVSVSIHVYGANIGAVRRSVYAEDGTRKPFVSGYSNQTLPNPWDRSRELAQS